MSSLFFIIVLKNYFTQPNLRMASNEGENVDQIMHNEKNVTWTSIENDVDADESK